MKEKEPSFTKIALLLAIFNFCDAISTYYALTNGKNVIELNYYMAKIISCSWFYFFAVKMIASFVFIIIGYIADKILVVYNIPKWVITCCKMFLLILAVFFVAITVHNIILSIAQPISSISLVLCQS